MILLLKLHVSLVAVPRNVYNEDLRPPKVIPNCSIMFQVWGIGVKV